ncbi:hypothetical protein P3L10_019168 [Capsicum annuum]
MRCKIRLWHQRQLLMVKKNARTNEGVLWSRYIWKEKPSCSLAHGRGPSVFAILCITICLCK